MFTWKLGVLLRLAGRRCQVSECFPHLVLIFLSFLPPLFLSDHIPLSVTQTYLELILPYLPSAGMPRFVPPRPAPLTCFREVKDFQEKGESDLIPSAEHSASGFPLC